MAKPKKPKGRKTKSKKKITNIAKSSSTININLPSRVERKRRQTTNVRNDNPNTTANYRYSDHPAMFYRRTVIDREIQQDLKNKGGVYDSNRVKEDIRNILSEYGLEKVKDRIEASGTKVATREEKKERSRTERARRRQDERKKRSVLLNTYGQQQVSDRIERSDMSNGELKQEERLDQQVERMQTLGDIERQQMMTGDRRSEEQIRRDERRRQARRFRDKKVGRGFSRIKAIQFLEADSARESEGDIVSGLDELRQQAGDQRRYGKERKEIRDLRSVRNKEEADRELLRQGAVYGAKLTEAMQEGKANVPVAEPVGMGVKPLTPQDFRRTVSMGSEASVRSDISRISRGGGEKDSE